jgi:4-alpha-glucanotransferase
LGKEKYTSMFENRLAGVLLHITSLPGPGEKGQLGADAERFMRWLSDGGFAVWQILPVGPTDTHGSPYSLLSAFAGNPEFIHHEGSWHAYEEIEKLCSQCTSVHSLTEALLLRLDTSSENEGWKKAYHQFIDESKYWLDDYAFYDVIKRETGQPWYLWPETLKHRHPLELRRYALEKKRALETVKLLQFLFHIQWKSLKSYASKNNLRIYGDMPIFCSYDSADVWSHPEYFMLDSQGHMLELTGVPPDAFSDTGQLWGGPQYNWDQLEKDGYNWWVKRIQMALDYYDLLRIDHFRGLESYWVVPAGSENAVNGHWQKGPGMKLFKAVERALGQVPFIAEDLGVITPEVDQLRKDLGMPGMRVLQFDFDDDPCNPHAPQNHTKDSVVYTGTHDNDTLMGWWSGLSEDQRQRVLHGVPHPELGMPWSVIDCALESVGFLSIIPMQDLLGLGSESRMNTPGQPYGNWRWRFQWQEVAEGLEQKTKNLVLQAGR